MSNGSLKTPLKYEDGPDYCTVTDANGGDFALTVQPTLMKEMESAFIARGMVTEELDGRLMAMPSSLNDACRTIEMAQSEIIKLRSQLVKARAALERIEQIGLRAPTFSHAIQPGNIAHAALIELSLPDEKG